MIPGTVLRNAWALYASNLQHLVTIALAVNALVTAAVYAFGLLDWLVALLIGFVGGFWVQGVLVRSVDDVRNGTRDLSVRKTIQEAFPRINVLSASGLLAAVGIGIGCLLFLVPGLILLTMWSMIVPVIMLENAGVFRCFSRSRELVRGNGWPVFTVVVVTLVLLLAAQFIVSALLAPVASAALANIIGVVVASILTPFAAAAWTLTYYELRHLSAAPA